MTNNEKVEIHFGLQPLASAENKNKKKYTRNKNKRSTNQTQTNQIKLYTYIQGKVQSLLDNRQPRAGSTRLSLEKKKQAKRLNERFSPPSVGAVDDENLVPQ